MKTKKPINKKPGTTIGKTKVNFYLSDWVLEKLREMFPKGERGRFVEDAVVKHGRMKKPKRP